MNLTHLLSKYDVPGPRYTSYPTVPVWKENITGENFQNNLLALTGDDPLSLYFHLPFCEILCHFCGCMQVITKDHSKSRQYTDILLSEMGQIKDHLKNSRKKVSQIHFGGGTPNFFQPAEMQEIVSFIKTHFSLLPDAEIAIEMHPRTSTQAFCEKIAELGFNRISLGVQDLDPHVQKLINRHQTYEMTQGMITLLRSLGFRSFNMDLVYGLPGQTMEGWEKTLNQVLEMNPDRLAVYSYAHVPWVRPVQRTFEESDLPAPDQKIKLFEKAYSTFTQNGFDLIGMDHFAKKDDELSKALREGTIHRNIMGYSTKRDAHQIGFGVSSISNVNKNYFQNAKKIPDYFEKIKEGRLATFRGCLLNQDDLVRQDLIMEIMCKTFVNIPVFEKKWGLSFENYFEKVLPELVPFVKDGLLLQSTKEIRVKNEGFLFLRNIAMVFDVYLNRVRDESKNPVFSRTV